MGFALKNEYLPHHTYEDYQTWEGKWELISGIPYAMSPSPEFYHQDINVNIVSYLKTQLAQCGNCVAVMSFDWKLSEDTVLQPDVSVTCGKFTQRYLEETPELIFEILSPSSHFRDKTIKHEIYEAQGVKYYIIVNPKNKNASVYELVNGKYALTHELQNGSFNFTLSKCSFDFDFSKIW